MSTGALHRIIEEGKTRTPEEQLVAHLREEERTADLTRICSKYVGMKTGGGDAFAARKAKGPTG